jgi:hypothetical protein
MMESDATLLYGTEEPPPEGRTLRAGQLSAELVDGNLRDIRYAGTELIRAISFLVRDRRWATFAAEIADLQVAQDADSFVVSYRATVRDGAAVLTYTARIAGAADGTLTFACALRPQTDFVTCRAGFVVLHPAHVAGQEVAIEHADGRHVQAAFPHLIDPVQPMLDLRALTHDAAPGLAVTCRMEGDVFEMEDQRNWSDASFKTYVRPLSRPWPYTLPAGEVIRQAVTLHVEAAANAIPATASADDVQIALGDALGEMPAIGLGCTPQEARDALPHAQRLAGIATLVCRFDPGQGHAHEDFAAFRALADAVGCGVELQLVLHSLDDYDAELRQAAEAMQHAGLTPTRIAVSPAPDLKSVTPGQPWPDCPPLERVYESARAIFPGIPLAGGTFAYFTELNRKRPPLAQLDAVTFSTSPLVHAADDRSVMESLQALPAIAASARAIAGDRPLLVGPSAIGLRDNPYGPAPLRNPAGARLAMGGADPRQAALFNAAWTLGYIARFAEAGVARIALSGPVGEAGVLDAARDYPVLAVILACAALRGAKLYAAHASAPDRVLALCAGHTLLLANITPAPLRVSLPDGVSPTQALDVPALRGGTGWRALSASADPELGAYGVMCCSR